MNFSPKFAEANMFIGEAVFGIQALRLIMRKHYIEAEFESMNCYIYSKETVGEINLPNCYPASYSIIMIAWIGSYPLGSRWEAL